MKFSTVLAISTILTPSLSIPFIPSKRDAPGTISLPFHKKSNDIVTKNRFAKRQGSVQVADGRVDSNLIYFVELLLGTPPQSTQVQLDTGSSILFVETDTSDICSASPPNPCTNYGSYDANSSSTYVYVDSAASVEYAGGDGATGDDAMDILTIGGATLQNFVFAIQDKSTILEGVFGVGFVDPSSVDSSITAALTAQGYIASPAFSLYQNDDTGSGGFVLFGGVDTTKYCGNLVTNDMVPSSDTDTEITELTLPCLNIGGTDDSGNPLTFTGGSSPGTVLLDSGTSFTLLTPDLVQSIWDSVGAVPDNSGDSTASIACVLSSSTASIDFSFNGITIKVPMTQLSIAGGTLGCTFGIGKASAGVINILGDTVLSSFYIVYDLANKQISLAPAIFAPSGSNVLTIAAGPNGVPHVPGPDCPTTPPTTGSATVTTASQTSTSSATSSSSTSSASVTSSSTSSVSSSSSSVSSSSSGSSSSSSSSSTSSTSSSSSASSTSSSSSASSSSTSSTSSISSTSSVSAPTSSSSTVSESSSSSSVSESSSSSWTSRSSSSRTRGSPTTSSIRRSSISHSPRPSKASHSQTTSFSRFHHFTNGTVTASHPHTTPTDSASWNLERPSSTKPSAPVASWGAGGPVGNSGNGKDSSGSGGWGDSGEESSPSGSWSESSYSLDAPSSIPRGASLPSPPHNTAKPTPAVFYIDATPTDSSSWDLGGPDPTTPGAPVASWGPGVSNGNGEESSGSGSWGGSGGSGGSGNSAGAGYTAGAGNTANGWSGGTGNTAGAGDSAGAVKPTGTAGSKVSPVYSNGAIGKHEGRHLLIQYLVAASLLIFAL